MGQAPPGSFDMRSTAYIHVCKAARGLSCGLLEISVDLIYFSPRGKKFLMACGAA